MLIPLISESLRQAGLSPRDIDLFVVALGPGSFTGLRMGVVAAKAFAYATGCKLIGVDIMTALAYDAAAWHAPNDAGLVCPMIDIGRGEVLAAFYQIDQQHALRVREPQIFQPADLAFNLCSSTVCIGSGLKLLRSAQRKVKRVLSSRDCPNDSTDRTDRLEARSCGGLDSVGDLVESAGTTDNAVFVPDEFAAPRITTIARLGLLNFLERGPDDLFKLEPIYSRPSAAEEIAKPATGSK
jgi:tRNA threonylcarbamoyl adenosine modification protein YeaZ